MNVCASAMPKTVAVDSGNCSDAAAALRSPLATGIASAVRAARKLSKINGNHAERQRKQNTNKTHLYETFVVRVLMHDSEGCKEDERKWADSWDWQEIAIRNEAIRQKLWQKETIIEKKQKRRLKWFGHAMHENE